MELIIDLDSGNLLTSLVDPLPLTDVDVKRGDTFPVTFRLVSGPTNDKRVVPLPAASAITFAAKAKDKFDGPALVFADDFTLTGGANTTATGEAVGFGQNVTSIAVTDSGSDYIDPPTVTIGAPDAGGTQATATATIGTAQVTSIDVLDGGFGYGGHPLITIAAPTTGGIQATATPSLAATTIGTTGGLSNISLADSGSYSAAPIVTVAAPPSGTTATATAILEPINVTGVTVTDGGSGYVASPVVTITTKVNVPNVGGGFTVEETVYTDAKAVIENGKVSRIEWDNPPDFNFSTSNTTVVVTGGGATPATETAAGTEATAVVDAVPYELNDFIELESSGSGYDPEPIGYAVADGKVVGYTFGTVGESTGYDIKGGSGSGARGMVIYKPIQLNLNNHLVFGGNFLVSPSLSVSQGLLASPPELTAADFKTDYSFGGGGGGGGGGLSLATGYYKTAPTYSTTGAVGFSGGQLIETSISQRTGTTTTFVTTGRSSGSSQSRNVSFAPRELLNPSARSAYSNPPHQNLKLSYRVVNGSFTDVRVVDKGLYPASTPPTITVAGINTTQAVLTPDFGDVHVGFRQKVIFTSLKPRVDLTIAQKNSSGDEVATRVVRLQSKPEDAISADRMYGHNQFGGPMVLECVAVFPFVADATYEIKSGSPSVPYSDNWRAETPSSCFVVVDGVLSLVLSDSAFPYEKRIIALAKPIVIGREVTSVNVENAGAGYNNTPTVVVTGGNPVAGGDADVFHAFATDSKTIRISKVSGTTQYETNPAMSVTAGLLDGASITTPVNLLRVLANRITDRIDIIDGGSGYDDPDISVVGGNGTGAEVRATSYFGNGGIRSLEWVSKGVGYTSPPTIVIPSSPLALLGGIQARARATGTAGVFKGIKVLNGGSGYSSQPTLSFASDTTNKVIGSAVVGADGNIVGASLISKPTLYSINDNPAIVVSGGGTKAFTTLTIGSNVTDNDTVTLGSRTYTFKSALSSPTPLANEVLIGASPAASLDNLKAAVNKEAGGGTTYAAATVTHPDVTATTNTDSTQRFEAKVAGVAGNSIVSTENNNHLSFPFPTFTGGLGVAATLTPVFNPFRPVSRIVLGNAGTGYGPTAVGLTIFGGGTGAVAEAVVTNGKITGVRMLSSGAGYGNGATVEVNGGVGASFKANVSSVGVTGIDITNAGSGYSSPPSVLISGNAKGTARIGGPATLTGINITNKGFGYVDAPTVTISRPEEVVVPVSPTEDIPRQDSGSFFPAVIRANFSAVQNQSQRPFTLLSFSVLDGGDGYSEAPTIEVSGYTLGTQTVRSGVVARANMSNGKVTSVTILNKGIYDGRETSFPYVTGSRPYPTVSAIGGSNGTATPTATSTLTPSRAEARAIVLGSKVVSAPLLNTGRGYRKKPTVTFSPPTIGFTGLVSLNGNALSAALGANATTVPVTDTNDVRFVDLDAEVQITIPQEVGEDPIVFSTATFTLRVHHDVVKGFEV